MPNCIGANSIQNDSVYTLRQNEHLGSEHKKNTEKMSYTTLHAFVSCKNVKVSLWWWDHHTTETQNEEKMASDFRHSRNVKTQRQVSNERII